MSAGAPGAGAGASAGARVEGGGGARRWRLVLFDWLRGTPAALGVLRRRLGTGAVVRLLPAFARRSLGGGGAGLARPLSRREQFTMHQLEQIIVLDRVLREDAGLSEERARALLEEVVAASGSAFLGWAFAPVAPDAWARATPARREAIVTRVLGRLFNIEGEVTEQGDRAFGFDVTACQFVALAAELGRPDLASLFCLADSARFERPGSEIRLARTGTIARGAPRCDFRFSWKA